MRRALLIFLVLIVSLTVHAAAKAAQQTARPFTIVVLPDTQRYTYGHRYHDHNPGKLSKGQYLADDMSWIKRSARKLNTRAVVQVGDISQQDNPAEYRFAQQQFSRLDGVVPYLLVQGNHDMGFKGHGRHRTANNRNSHFSDFFPRSRFKNKPWFGGSMDQTVRNAWYRFTWDGMKFMVLGLEYKPRDKAVAWANRVVAAHPDDRVIVFTHAYLARKKPRLWRRPNSKGLRGNDGRSLWKKLISRHDNIFMVLSGHLTGENHRVRKAKDGHKVIEILTDYQGWKGGGHSLLRYLTFHPEQDRIEVSTYSPSTDEHRKNKNAHFVVDYPMTPVGKTKQPVSAPRNKLPTVAAQTGGEGR